MNLMFSFQGKLQVEERGAQGFSQPHHFVPHTFMPPSNCDLCYQMIIGILNKGERCEFQKKVGVIKLSNMHLNST